jgi:hypothetical protein
MSFHQKILFQSEATAGALTCWNSVTYTFGSIHSAVDDKYLM